MTDRFKPHVASLVMLVRENNVLLLRRANTGWGDGLYTLPSGHVEEGETPSTAAARETQEEAGVTIDPAFLKHYHTLYRFNPETNKTYVDFFFVSTKWAGEPHIAEPEKCDDTRWFPIDNLPENIVPFVRDTIMHSKNSDTYTEVGF